MKKSEPLKPVKKASTGVPDPVEQEEYEEPSSDGTPVDPKTVKPTGKISEVTQAIEDLSSGAKTIEEVAELFKTRSWPDKPNQPSTSLAEINQRELQDYEPEPVGSRSEITLAWMMDKINDAQYKMLSDAAYSGLKKEAQEKEKKDGGISSGQTSKVSEGKNTGGKPKIP